MPSFTEARKIILDHCFPLGVERIGLLDAAGRVLASDIVAPWDMPLNDNSAMDGYAVRSGDCKPGSLLRITGYIGAGDPVSSVVVPGLAVKIMTGARIPPGCDAVVPVEEAEEKDGAVTIQAEVKRNQHIRFHGEDVASGDVVIPEGTIIRSPEISMLASFGKAVVPVYRKARVAILSTGDELMELGETPAPGKIINSNALSLAAAVRECGAEPLILGIARDNKESHREKMIEGLKADAFITSAGVSAGDRDFVRDVLDELGVRQLFWKVDIKPGGPTAFAVKDNKPIFSLPGNPVSTMVTFEEFVRPGLLRMMGHRKVFRRFHTATLTNDARKKPGKLNFIRVQIEVRDGEYFASSAGEQQTGFLRTMLRADAIAVLPAECTEVKAGEKVQFHLLRDDVMMTDC